MNDTQPPKDDLNTALSQAAHKCMELRARIDMLDDVLRAKDAPRALMMELVREAQSGVDFWISEIERLVKP